MAKDGTNRGGRRVRAGDKPLSAVEKIQKGQSVRIMDNDLPTLTPSELDSVDLPEGAVLEGLDMPKPSEYLSARQKNGEPLGADEIFKETWLWLKERGCERLVNPRLIEAYAQAFARYIQCEEATSSYGLLGKHPTTGGVITSPFVAMSQQYQKSANLLWYEIYDVVKQNCTSDYEGGNAEHGSRTYFRITDIGNTDVFVKTSCRPFSNNTESAEFILGGDDMMEQLLRRKG